MIGVDWMDAWCTLLQSYFPLIFVAVVSLAMYFIPFIRHVLRTRRNFVVHMYHRYLDASIHYDLSSYSNIRKAALYILPITRSLTSKLQYTSGEDETANS